MKDTALGEGLVTNIALGFASCYICHSTPTLSCIFHTNWRQCFNLDDSISMAPELDQHLHVLRDIDYLILKDISVTSPPIGGIL